MFCVSGSQNDPGNGQVTEFTKSFFHIVLHKDTEVSRNQYLQLFQ